MTDTNHEKPSQHPEDESQVFPDSLDDDQDDDEFDDEFDDDRDDDDENDENDDRDEDQEGALNEAESTAAESEHQSAIDKLFALARDLQLGKRAADALQFTQRQFSKEHRRRTFVALGIVAIALMVMARNGNEPVPTNVTTGTNNDTVYNQGTGDAQSQSLGAGGAIEMYAPPTQPAPEQPGMRPPYHLVQQYDTLYSIARMYNVTLDELFAANPGLSAHPDLIHINDQIFLPAGPVVATEVPAAAPTQVSADVQPGSVSLGAGTNGSRREHSGNINEFGTRRGDGRYCASEGDSPWHIAQMFGISLEQFYAWNGMDPNNPDLKMGDWVIVSNPGVTSPQG